MTDPTIEAANYKCDNCSHGFSHQPRPTQCPECGNLYVQWVDYDGWYSRNKHLLRVSL